MAQQLVPPRGHDLRVLVAGGTVIGAIKRVAKRGEWRTNVALGAARVPVEPSPAACDLALAAAAAISGDLVGVDILPVSPGRYVVLEVNGAVDFSAESTRPAGTCTHPQWTHSCALPRASRPSYPSSPKRQPGSAGYVLGLSGRREASVNSRNSPVTR